MRANELSAAAAADAIRRGELTSEALVQSCLDHIASVEDRIGAWAYLDREKALAQARAADRARSSGAKLGSLHGIPVGIKDIFDTADMPTENGTVLHAGRRPSEDATAVRLLRQSGAVILGKTVTTELAVYSPGRTTNPHDPGRTPGGSSSGSAAAVAASMLPLALGTQTNGSVIRPASYCGVYGFKPTHGSISRHGVLAQSRTLDHVGMYARSVEDLALLSHELISYDANDPDSPPAIRFDPLGTGEISRPRVAFVKTPLWPNATEGTRQAFRRLGERWGELVRDVELPPLFDSAVEWHRIIMESDLAVSFEEEYRRGRSQLSDVLVEMIERGQHYLATSYSKAQAGALALRRKLEHLFESCDVVLTPATQGSAPLGLASTGSPMFCTIWTLTGVPALSLPLLEGEDGMPLGAQLVGPRGSDARLLAIARWLVEYDAARSSDRRAA